MPRTLVVILALIVLALAWLVWSGESDGDAGLDGGEVLSGARVTSAEARRHDDAGSDAAIVAEAVADGDAPTSGEAPPIEVATAPLARVHGRVVDPFGTWIASAVVRLQHHDLGGGAPGGRRPDERETTTDREGRFAFADCAHPFELRFRVRPVDHVDAYHAVALRDAADVDLGDIVTRPGTSIAGRVLDGRGVGVVGATVRVDVKADAPKRGLAFVIFGGGDVARLSAEARSTVSDADGAYRVTGLGPGVATIEAEIAGRPPVQREDVRVEEGKARTGIDLVIDDGRTVTGLVRDATGEPLPGVAISRASGPDFLMRLLEAQGFPGGNADATTDDEGRFVLAGLPRGALRISARKSGHRLLRHELGESETTVSLQMEPSSAIGGLVTTSDGAPASGVALSGGGFIRTLLGEEAAGLLGLPRPEGAYAILDLPDDEVRFTVRATACAPVEVHVAELRPGEVRRRDVTLRPGHVVAGRVVDRTGAAAAHAKVTCAETRTDDRGSSSTSTVTDDDGAFSFGQVADGVYALSASLAGWIDSDPLMVDVAGADVGDLLLRLGVGGDVLGRVVAGDGEPVAGAVVALEGDGSIGPATPVGRSQATSSYETKTANDGTFELRGVAPGSYRAEARRADLRPASSLVGISFDVGSDAPPAGKPVVVEAARTLEIELVLEERPSIGGTVWITGAIPPGTTIAAHRRSETGTASFFPTATADVGSDGRWEIDGLDPGPYGIELSFPGCARAATEEVSLLGGRTLLDFRLVTGSVAGLVTDPEGQPLDARVRVRAEDQPLRMGAVRVASLGRGVALSVSVEDQPPATDGRYRIPVVPVGEHQIKASRGKVSAVLPAIVEAGRETVVDFELERR